MCLKFLLESNPENQALVSSLEAREVAPTDAVTKEALEKMGANLDVENGKVKITPASRKASWVKNQIAERERERLRGSLKENGRVLGEIDDVADLINDTHLHEDSGDTGNGMGKGKGKEKVIDDDDDDDELEFM